jgi:hypothetical protein
VRIDVSTTSKGFYSWNHLVEQHTEGDETVDIDALLVMSDKVEREMKNRYGDLQDRTRKEL